ncbi:MAG: hypothetical protein ACE5FN_08485 [Leptospirillia bacterium]
MTVAVLLVALFAAPAWPQNGGQFTVVAHAATSIESLSTTELGRIFTRARTSWRDGTLIRPVELGGTSPTRESFYHSTLNIGMNEVVQFWINKAMTSGVRPPKAYPSESMVLRFVARTPGAIGFVGPDAKLPDGVKQVSVK